MSVLASKSTRFDSSGTGARCEPALALRLRCCVADMDGVIADAACGDDDALCLRRELVCGEDDEVDENVDGRGGNPSEAGADEMVSENGGTGIPDGLATLKENVADDGAAVGGLLLLVLLF